LTYSETFIARLLDESPVVYVKKNISKHASNFYAFALVVLYIFGFGGFQFNGIDTVTTIAFNNLMGIELSEIERYLFVIVPIIIISSGIILTKKHNLFINALSSMIGFAVASYFLFFFVFLGKTGNHIPLFLERAWIGFTNPVSMGIGIPVGLIFGLQRIIQTSEAGLGTSPLASEEGKDAGARNSALTQVIPTAITVVVSLFITSYITSYGVDQNIITLPSSGIERLTSFFNTAESVTGLFGMGIISIFAILSGITTLLGSYFFLSQLYLHNTENKNIAIYITLIVIAGTLAVFGFDIIFDVVDILLFAVSGLNILALTLYVTKNKKGVY
jgi:Na+/alanine symporter